MRAKGEDVTSATQTFRAMKTVLALMAKVSTAITTHITRSECRTSRYRARKNQLGCLPPVADHIPSQFPTLRLEPHTRATHH